VRVGRTLATDGPHAVLLEAFFDAVRDGAELSFRTTRADDEVIGQRGQATDAEKHDVGGLPVGCELDDPVGQLERPALLLGVLRAFLHGVRRALHVARREAGTPAR
jgi:hypothetical protein